MKPIWVNGIRYNGAKEAAERMSLLLGYEIDTRWVSHIIRDKISTSVNGVAISPTPPDSDPAAPVEPVKQKKAKRGIPKQPEQEPEPAALNEKPADPPEPEDSPDEYEYRKSFQLPLIRYPKGETPLDRGLSSVYS
jgi:hypothetical protein